MAGTYTESLTLNKPVSLTGVSSATTILRAEPNDRVLTVTGAAITGQVVISGLMITRGDVVSPTGGFNSGGGVLLLDNAWPSFYHVTFFNNRAVHGGGLWSFGSVSITGTTFSNNITEGLGGGIWVNGEISIYETNFTGNVAVNGGGGVYANGPSKIINSVFLENQCTSTACDGGGIRSGGSVIVSGTTFSNNTAQRFGGGLFTNEDATIDDSIFADNSSSQRGGAYIVGSAWINDSLFVGNNGGGIAVQDTLRGVTQSIFVNNSASGNGGAVYAWQPAGMRNERIAANSAILINNLFADNTAGLDGAVLYFDSGVVEIVHNTIAAADFISGQAIYVMSGTVAMTNTIITSHAVGIESAGGVVSEDYNLYFGNVLDFSGSVTSGGSSIFDADPLFLNPAVGDYHLGAGSAALDNALDLGILFDLDGNPRPYGSGPDRGAYEALLASMWRIYLPAVFKP